MSPIEQLRSLLEDASPGPWKYDWGNWAVEVDNRDLDSHRDDVCSLTQLDQHYRDEDGFIRERNVAGRPVDGELIALLRNLAPKFLEICDAASSLLSDGWDDVAHLVVAQILREKLESLRSE